MGEEFIQLSNARIRQQEDNMKILVDFSFDDQIVFGVDTQALVNWPKPGMASLPISLTFTLVKFSGTVRISLELTNYLACY